MKKINFENLPSTATPINAENLNAIQNNAEEAINGIIESNTTGNNNYIKFADGTLICYGRTSISGINCNEQWGSIYSGNTFAKLKFPVKFVEKPKANVITSEGHSFFISKISCNTEQIVNFEVLRPVSDTGLSSDFDWIAIGRWK